MIWMQNAERSTKERSEAELEALILRMAGGERESLAELYRRTRAAVYGLALSYLKNPADAEDVCQDAFVRAWNAAPDYVPRGHAMSWLLTIVKHLSLDQLRRKSRETALDEEQWQQLPADGTSQLSLEDRSLLEFLMQDLSEEESRIVCLHAVAGLKHREIAELTGLGLSTVLSKYHRSLKKLKDRMEGENR